MNFLRMKCTKSTIFVFAMLLTGISCSVSREDQLQRRADRGDIQAMMELAAANESLTGGGFIRKPNTGKSKELYRKAAALGHTPAMYVLSQFLSDSITNEERVMWLKKGAELGNKACMVELMNGYFESKYGLPNDIGAYLYWESRLSEVTMMENGKDKQIIAERLKKGEIRRRREMNYDGQIRPLP